MHKAPYDHTIPLEFEDRCFTLKTNLVPRAFLLKVGLTNFKGKALGTRLSKNALNVSVPTTAEKSETQQLAVILDLCLRKTLACSGLSVIGDDRIKRPGDE